MKATAPFGIDSSKQAAQDTLNITPSTGTSGKSKFLSLASRECRVSPSASATRSAALAPLESGMASIPSPHVSRKAAARSQAHPPTWTFTRNASAPFAANAANKSLRVRTTRGVLTARSAARNAAPALPLRGLDARDRAGGCVRRHVPSARHEARRVRVPSLARQPLRVVRALGRHEARARRVEAAVALGPLRFVGHFLPASTASRGDGVLDSVRAATYMRLMLRILPLPLQDLFARPRPGLILAALALRWRSGQGRASALPILAGVYSQPSPGQKLRRAKLVL